MFGYWSNMVGFGFTSGQKKSKNNVFPEMTQNGLEMVPIASGGPGNRFYSIITFFHIIKRNFFFLLFITPIPCQIPYLGPVKFRILCIPLVP